MYVRPSCLCLFMLLRYVHLVNNISQRQSVFSTLHWRVRKGVVQWFALNEHDFQGYYNSHINPEIHNLIIFSSKKDRTSLEMENKICIQRTRSFYLSPNLISDKEFKNQLDKTQDQNASSIFFNNNYYHHLLRI